jgi:lysylphosphatidylglycerol synthetase-like protein (DUF2156 family)
MPWNTADKNSSRPTLSIVLVIAFQALLGSLLLVLALRVIRLEYFSDQAFPDPGAAQGLATILLVAILCIVNAIGLFKLRNWSRWLSLLLSSVAVLAGGLGVLFYKRHEGFDFTPQLFELLLIVSVLVSIWWWILFMLRGVREQFH